MAHDSPPHRPFQRPAYELASSIPGLQWSLDLISPADAETLGRGFAAIDPWAAYGLNAAQLAAFFAKTEVDCCRRSIRGDGQLVGAAVVRSPWLHGPYLQFLGLLPGCQGTGAGKAVLDWMEQEAGPATRNLWLCVTASNTRARSFYERHGFTHAADLDALVADGMDEILMRKRRLATPRAQG